MKVKVNFIPPEKNISATHGQGVSTGRHRNTGRRIVIGLVIFFVMALAVFSSSVVFSDENLTKNSSRLDFLGTIGRLITSGNKKLAGEKNDRVNLLIIGIGGSGHESGNLADTIILGSYQPSTGQTAMVSVPRDLSVNDEKRGLIKINAVYAYAEAKEKNSGGQAMVKAMEQILATKIGYYTVVDFSGFEKIIDEFGGVDIEVEKDLIDPEYPIEGKEGVYPVENRYETLTIRKGQQHMDGSLALKYARSRHALNGEGSDFARSKRQQKILTALKEKIVNLDTLTDPKKVKALLTAYRQHIRTNLELWEILRLAEIGRNIQAAQIIHYGLTDDENGLLYAKMIDGAYMLWPKGENFSLIRNLWQNVFSLDAKTKPTELKTDVEPTAITELTPKTGAEPTATGTVVNLSTEAAELEIQNGTWIAGYAAQEKARLEKEGLKVTKTANADRHDYEKTVIYNLSGGKNQNTLIKLESLYKTATASSVPLTIDSAADFVIILGAK